MKRSRGQSAIAGAAYRAGERLTDTRLEKISDYTARSRDVWHKEILAPQGAPDWVLDREKLWNAAEAAERRKDGRPARDVTLGLPWLLTSDEHEELARTFAQREFVDKGHAVDLCFHKYGKRITDTTEEGRETLRRWAKRSVPFLESDECETSHLPHVKIERDAEGDVLGYKIFQPHAHAYVTPRAITSEGFEAKRNRDLDRSDQTMNWRYDWPKHVNEVLERRDYNFRVSATALEEDEDLPLKPEDMPLASYHIEQEGRESVAREDRDFNRVHNEAVRNAAATAKLEDSGALEAPPERFARVKAWWTSLRQSFSQWRDYIEERASTWFNKEPVEPQEVQQEENLTQAEEPRDDRDAEPER